TLVEAGHAATAVSTAYYAMLYAARAALSERDLHARSHSGIWGLFRDEFVVTGEFNEELAQAAQRAQARREASDYAAESFEMAEAAALVATAERFVAAIERLAS
ncbi:MAG: HEPN domain-containing protein, partial [Thermoleophilia bacterium]